MEPVGKRAGDAQNIGIGLFVQRIGERFSEQGKVVDDHDPDLSPRRCRHCRHCAPLSRLTRVCHNRMALPCLVTLWLAGHDQTPDRSGSRCRC